jgi:cytochrome P450
MTTIDENPVGDADTDLDHHGPAFREHNYAIMDDLRERCPVAKSSSWGGWWMITSYDAVFDACQDPGLFSSDVRKAIPPNGAGPLIPIDMDPPVLQKYRKLLLPYMSPKAAAREEPGLRAMANTLIDAFAETGRADLAEQLFTPLPARWILSLLDFDESRWPEWIKWLHSMVHDRAAEPEKALAGVMNVQGEIMREIAARRAAPGGRGVLSDLIVADVEGERLGDEELVGIVILLLLGGMDTTAGLTGNAFLTIDADPELRRRLMAEPEILPRATEEFLRHDTPAQGLTRIVTRDEEWHGRQLRAGDRVMLMFAAANRDPAVFDEPGRIDLDRAENRHMSFALGVHRCLGSNFARTMFQVMLTELLRRLPDVHVAGTVERLPDAGDVYAVSHLPVAFTPGRRENAAVGRY